MPTYTVTSPDGKQWDVNAPEGATQEQVLSYAKSQFAAQQKPEPEAPQAPPDSLARQAGLFGRAALRGVAGIPQIVTEPIRQLALNPALRAMGLPGAASLTAAADVASSNIGLPEPANKAERIVDKSVEMGMGGGGFAGTARLAGSAIPRLAALGDTLGAAAGLQAFSGAAAGAAGQQAKESGSGFGAQLGSTLLGGLAGAGVGSLAIGGAKALANLPRLATNTANVDQRITNILVQQGVDPASIGPAVLSKMRDDVKAALKTGGSLDDAAVARLADYARVGATPTRAGITLDPFDVTMQRNASKIAAATGARDAKLPQITDENAKRLMGVVTGMEPNPDTFAAGARGISDILGQNAAMQAEKKGLYDTANKMAGGSIPVDRGAFTNAAFEGLAKANKLAFLPEEIGSLLDQISKGEITRNGQKFAVPFDVSTIDMLKTSLATAQRGAKDGNVKQALSIVRDALEKTPVAPAKASFGGSQLVTEQGANFLKQSDTQAGELLAALDKARSSAKKQFDWQESAPAIEAALAGEAPDRFVNKFFTSAAASFGDASKFVGVLSPEGKNLLRGTVIQDALNAATQRGREASASNFNGPGLSNWLKNIGDRKLSLILEPSEIEALKSAGRVGGYETFQPTASAVNNSNTAAGVAGLLQGISKYAKPVAKALPFGEAAIAAPLDYLTLRASEKPLLNIGRSLLQPGPSSPSFAQGLLGPALYSGGLLAAPDQ